jgi:16S rRNA (cytosine1402-N4)-methyltransferase
MISGHVSVLKDDAIKGLGILRGKKYIDATVGAGGHAIEILKRGGRVLGIDTDINALEIAKQNLAEQIENLEKETYRLVHGNFRNIAALARGNTFDSVSGILFDLGVSSMQLDMPERGFSYRFGEAPLDARMNQHDGKTAAILLKQSSQEELYDIFSTYGEEQLAGDIARAVYRTRNLKPIETVGDLTSVIGSVVPNENTRQAVLSRIFQALRIVVNDEVNSLKEALRGAGEIIEPGGRLVVISFHSIEDRIVKQFMREKEWIALTKHPIEPNDTEKYVNSRSRSAKLRIAEKK